MGPRDARCGPEIQSCLLLEEDPRRKADTLGGLRGQPDWRGLWATQVLLTLQGRLA